MTFDVQKITFVYEQTQDRLNLLCHNDQQQQFIGILTRQMLKVLLHALPKWLNQHQPQSHEYNEFQHHSAQQEINCSDESIQVQQNVPFILVSSINLAQVEGHIQLLLVDEDQQHNLRILLHELELHKIIATMLEKASNWDLVNPWQEQGITSNNIH